jgi:hypothetical protein
VGQARYEACGPLKVNRVSTEREGSPVNIPVYNARKPQMNTARVARALCPLFLLLPLVCLAASNWSAPERELADKIAAATGPGAVSLSLANRSSLAQGEVDAITSALRTQLSVAGLRLVSADQAAASVQVTLSENVQSYIWIAQIQQGNNSPVLVMVRVGRAGPAAPAAREAAPVAIAKLPLWSQDERILDVGVIDSPARLIVLEPERIALYSRQNPGQWQMEQQFPISHFRPWPRDLRGRVVLRKDHLFDAYLPGVICAATSGERLHVACHESDDPWPLAGNDFSLNAFFSSTRNFFTGVLTPGLGKQTAVAAFYSAAPMPRDKYALWLFAEADGQLHAVDGMTDLVVSAGGWGSDIASVKSTCGAGWQVLASNSSDGTTSDAVRAFQFPDRDPVPVSEPVDMGGPVLSLWTEPAGTSAVAVSRNLQTGRYEAFRLAVSCGQ